MINIFGNKTANPAVAVSTDNYAKSPADIAAEARAINRTGAVAVKDITTEWGIRVTCADAAALDAGDDVRNHKTVSPTRNPTGREKVIKRSARAVFNGIAHVRLPAGTRIKHVPGKFDRRNGKDKPAYDHTAPFEIDVHLRDGLQPNADGSITCRAEIKMREISPEHGSISNHQDQFNYYWYLNLFPVGDMTGDEHEITFAETNPAEVAANARVYMPETEEQRRIQLGYVVLTRK